MAVPTVMTDLSVTAASNSPAGTDTIDNSTGPDDYIRALAAIIRRGQAQGANVASAATVNIGAITDGNYVSITGTTTITAFDTVAAGISRILVFAGALTLTHNATSLILPGGANITTAAGDVFMFVSEGSGNWRCVGYTPAVGNVTPSGTTTLTNKTINLTSNTLSGTVAQFNTACSDDNFAFIGQANVFTAQQTFAEVKDTAYNLTGTSIDPANGAIQYKTLSGNTTFTEALESGQAVLLAIDDGTAYTVTWPTMTWVKAGGTASAPTLATTGYTWVLLWKLSTTLYGTEVGQP